jgi:septum formation protein
MIKHQSDSPHSQHNASLMNPRLILASSSVYRRELLSRLQIPFDSLVPDIDETAQNGETPDATALRLAQQKAEAIAGQLAS